ncbi:alpha/beta hydrolase [Leeia sp. TBRC 13508]|uniref:Alpha/beta hydrolase n=1 Tax=Leeia speluncae TaxID=2884804 RepID=A0ABS8D193_9NEIS|nr:alpha/beta hydrolase [Leeia speluncae]MCB6181952.1 alpha/beta hydrolase [Leeia speluncae]
MNIADLEVLHQPAQSADSHLPPILFVHGAYCSASCWQTYLMPWLAKQGIESYAVSLPAHGQSKSPLPLPFLSIEDYRDAVLTVVKHLPSAPILAGHSLGGAVVQDVLSQLTLPGAILMASVPPSGLAASSVRVIGQQPDVWWQLLQLQWGVLDAENLAVLRKGLFTNHLPDEVLHSYIPMFQPESTRALWDLSLSGWINKPSLAHIPALVMGTSEDALFTQNEVKETAERFGVSPIIFNEMGHAMMLEHNWELVATTIANWVKTTYAV